MKKKLVCAGILVLVSGPFALAGDASDTFEQGMKDRHEGTKKVITSPTHLVEDTAEGMEGEQPVAGTTRGVATGTVKAGGQA
ncbi:MAG: hypothetical protein GY703_19305 [Gammaproteobacteria bacterium]|nr:hypothetical protein [Gammaproteobacteria bacterium]